MRVIRRTMKKEARRYAPNSRYVKGVEGRMSSVFKRAFVNMVKEIGCSGGGSSSH